MSDDTTSLYRHFAADGSLLYVGISLSWPTRTKAHVRGSRWFEQVAKVEIERFPTRTEALDAEREAIKREKPEFNVVHNRAHDAPARNARPAFNAAAVCDDPALRAIKGPGAIVGPALVYRDDLISVMVAHGEFGTAGELTELVLGNYQPDPPEWAMEMCAMVLTVSGPNDITMDNARDIRAEVIRKLRGHVQSVEAYDTDLALAVAYASRFPSEKSRKILNDVAVERGVQP